MMKELKLEGRYNENGFSTKRKRNRKNGAYLVGDSKTGIACFIY
jgi:hypothetical protein